MYGLNPHIYGIDDPNSPFYENPCDLCGKNDCYGCPCNTDESENEEN